MTPADAPRVHPIETRVYYGDTDQMGVVYYANYLRWFEMARNEYMRAVGYPHVRFEKEGLLLPVIETACRYLRPARYDDLVRIEAWIPERSRVRLRFHYRVVRAPDGEVLAEGHTVHVCLIPDGTPRRFPVLLLECLERFEAARPGGGVGAGA